MKVVEGVVPSNWICGSVVKWPRKNAKSASQDMAKPTDDWKEFELIKVKFVSGKYFSHSSVKKPILY
jgi:hypothetical protein